MTNGAMTVGKGRDVYRVADHAGDDGCEGPWGRFSPNAGTSWGPRFLQREGASRLYTSWKKGPRLVVFLEVAHLPCPRQKLHCAGNALNQSLARLRSLSTSSAPHPLIVTLTVPSRLSLPCPFRFLLLPLSLSCVPCPYLCPCPCRPARTFVPCHPPFLCLAPLYGCRGRRRLLLAATLQPLDGGLVVPRSCLPPPQARP